MSKQFAHIDDVCEGTHLVADGGFTCIEQGAELTVLADEDGLLYVPCRDGMHYLEGQLDDNRYVGLYLSEDERFTDDDGPAYDTDPWDEPRAERNAAQNADTRYKLGREHSDD